MTDNTALGDRMKAYERTTQTVFPRRLPVVIRVDGRAFHSYLRGADKPFDMSFVKDMGHVATALCQEIAGAVFAYHQSDEISVLVCDYQGLNVEPWFGGKLQKLVSISASAATSALGARRSGRPLFDSRAFVLPGEVEVANYFVWRQRDALRNSVSMAAQARIPHQRLHGVSSDEMQELLFTEHGINWNDYPASCRRGQVAVDVTEPNHTDIGAMTTMTRSRWVVQAAQLFTAEPGGFLAQTIPALPSFVS